MSKFPVISIEPVDAPVSAPKLEGAIDKYWLDLPNIGRCLLKADRRGAWVEKICANLAERIGLPVAGCELAQTPDGVKMIASPSFLLNGAREIAGERLLEDKIGENYLYTTEAILSVVDDLGVALPSNYQASATISTASDLMVGYLIFDSWIGNIDRHSKNWGIQQTLDGRKELLPTYDHGLSLGVRMPEDKLPLDLSDFSGDVRSSIQGEIGGALTMNALASQLLELKPEAANFWIERIQAIEERTIAATFERLPDGWISDVRKTFSIELLEASRDRLIKLDKEQSIEEQLQSSIKKGQSPSPTSTSDSNRLSI